MRIHERRLYRVALVMVTGTLVTMMYYCFAQQKHTDSQRDALELLQQSNRDLVGRAKSMGEGLHQLAKENARLRSENTVMRNALGVREGGPVLPGQYERVPRKKRLPSNLE